MRNLHTNCSVLTRGAQPRLKSWGDQGLGVGGGRLLLPLWAFESITLPRKIFENLDAKFCILVTCCEISCFLKTTAKKLGDQNIVGPQPKSWRPVSPGPYRCCAYCANVSNLIFVVVVAHCIAMRNICLCECQWFGDNRILWHSRRSRSNNAVILTGLLRVLRHLDLRCKWNIRLRYPVPFITLAESETSTSILSTANERNLKVDFKDTVNDDHMCVRNEWMNEWINERMNEWVSEWMNEWTIWRDLTCV